MKKTVALILIALGFLILFTSLPGSAESVTFTLIPANGNLSGPPGSTVGWGYIITNNTSNWLETLSLDAGSFTNGTPNLILDFPTVGPNSFVTEDFSNVVTASCSSPPCGLYEFTWDSDAPVGTVNSGTFTVSSEYFSGDPANPSSTDLGPAPDATADYSVTASPTTSPVPEPVPWILLCSGLVGIKLWRQRLAHR